MARNSRLEPFALLVSSILLILSTTQILGNAHDESQTEPKGLSSSSSLSLSSSAPVPASSSLSPQTARRVRALQSFNSADDSETRPCIPRDFGRGSFVCVCNSSYCDTVSLTIPQKIANLYHHPHRSSIPPSSQQSNPTLTSKTISLSSKSSFGALPDHFPSAVQQTFDEQLLQQQEGASLDGGAGQGQQGVQTPPAVAAEEPDYRGQVQIFTSTKSGSRLHKSIVQFNNDPDQPYRREHLLSRHDDLMVRTARSENAYSHTSPATTTSRSQKVFTFGDNGRATSVDIVSPIDSLNPLTPLLVDFPRPEKMTKYTIRRNIQYQKVLGYGGAFTDAAGINIGTLSQPTQENLMRSYFGQEGIDYSMGRVPIGGTDFSTRSYTYDDDTGKFDGGLDANLTNFALQPEDFKFKIPYIQWAQSLSGNKIKLVASPWSAPGWMKTSGRIHGFGRLKKEHYQLWADYFVRFLKEYQSQDIPIWGITTGNEPLNGYIPMWPFNCMGWKAADMRNFLASNLGPSLAAANLDPRVIMLDDNKGSVASWAREILTKNDSAQYVHGVGTHWYLDFLTSPDVLSKFHESYPDYFIVQTEACLGFTPWELEKVSLGNWERGEQYLEAIIHDSRNFVGGWIDWNLALDLKGGPNWAGLKADAAILVNSTADEFLKQPIYYGIGHVSKFVPPDSTRIEMTLDSYSPKSLMAVAFQRPDNGTVIVFLNKLRYEAKVGIRDEERGYLYLNIPPQSFQTLVYW